MSRLVYVSDLLDCLHEYQQSLWFKLFYSGIIYYKGPIIKNQGAMEFL